MYKSAVDRADRDVVLEVLASPSSLLRHRGTRKFFKLSYTRRGNLQGSTGTKASSWAGLEFRRVLSSDVNPFLHKFDSRSVHPSDQARLDEAHVKFVAAVYETEVAMRTLCRLTKSKFPNFDFEETSKVARANYRAKSAVVEA